MPKNYAHILSKTFLGRATPCKLPKLRNPYVNQRIYRWIALFLKRQNPLESMSLGLQRQELRKRSNSISGANGLTRMPRRSKARTPMLRPTACLLHGIASSDEIGRAHV